MHEEQENIVIIDPDMAKLFGSDQTISFLIDKVILTFFRDHKIKRTMLTRKLPSVSINGSTVNHTIGQSPICSRMVWMTHGLRYSLQRLKLMT